MFKSIERLADWANAGNSYLACFVKGLFFTIPILFCFLFIIAGFALVFSGESYLGCFGFLIAAICGAGWLAGLEYMD